MNTLWVSVNISVNISTRCNWFVHFIVKFPRIKELTLSFFSLFEFSESFRAIIIDRRNVNTRYLPQNRLIEKLQLYHGLGTVLVRIL